LVVEGGLGHNVGQMNNSKRQSRGEKEKTEFRKNGKQKSEGGPYSTKKLPKKRFGKKK